MMRNFVQSVQWHLYQYRFWFLGIRSHDPRKCPRFAPSPHNHYPDNALASPHGRGLILFIRLPLFTITVTVVEHEPLLSRRQ